MMITIIKIIKVANKIANLINLFSIEKMIMISNIMTITLAKSGRVEKKANISVMKPGIFI